MFDAFIVRFFFVQIFLGAAALMTQARPAKAPLPLKAAIIKGAAAWYFQACNNSSFGHHGRRI
ncbi:hypothetical protein BD289DRAFT_480353 [Coniella lustricola]|uniref:Uncharacterized protein n=1 Tax=Coniella lustricola TaxID=2025994 RepID=A0A2T3AFS8_9PEZI|nr:hypothetical protein BD289DRAFT_480353 [Coniella lustricola]